ncbi:hypothetical protein AXG93_4773s1030 [Marchantia polymorpha subsp. ruderalis]|uniref:Uncharacterized protein n=1 Tax=Marchantia polymorpha subsp. ruderalis TaxID=1480154 RepID=A0A176WIT5_MARPO|nr:hypothetical protein AXG93_4773s1030 [Marchantia polymorpha subsp. ruderalis]
MLVSIKVAEISSHGHNGVGFDHTREHILAAAVRGRRHRGLRFPIGTGCYHLARRSWFSIMNVMKTLLDSGQMTGAAFQSQDSSPTREMRARAHPDRMNGKNLGHCSPCSNYGRLTAPDQISFGDGSSFRMVLTARYRILPALDAQLLKKRSGDVQKYLES